MAAFASHQDQCFPARRSCLFRSGPVARNGLSLACNGSASRRTSIPGSTFPACYFASFLTASAARSALRLRCRIPVRPGSGRFNASGPLQLPLPARSAASSGLHSPSGLLPPSGSKRSTGFAASRPAFRIRPISLRSPLPVLFLKFRLRIIVPGPLRFRRLAVPQTSWNLLHYAPERACRQHFCARIARFSSTYYLVSDFRDLQAERGGIAVDKTRP